MSDTVEVAKAGVELVEKYAEKLSDVLMTYSGPAADLAMAVGRVGAMKEIAGGFVALGISYGAYRFLRWSVPRANALVKEEDNEMAKIVGLLIASLAAFVIGIVFGVDAAIALSDMFAWVGIFEPAVYLAAKALNL